MAHQVDHCEIKVEWTREPHGIALARRGAIFLALTDFPIPFKGVAYKLQRVRGVPNTFSLNARGTAEEILSAVVETAAPLFKATRELKMCGETVYTFRAGDKASSFRV